MGKIIKNAKYYEDFPNVVRTYIDENGKDIYEEWSAKQKKWVESLFAWGMCIGMEDSFPVSEKKAFDLIKKYGERMGVKYKPGELTK